MPADRAQQHAGQPQNTSRPDGHQPTVSPRHGPAARGHRIPSRHPHRPARCDRYRAALGRWQRGDHTARIHHPGPRPGGHRPRDGTTAFRLSHHGRSAQHLFPAVHGATAGDPRTAYKDTAIRPWFVVFDGDATTYLDGLNTTWYDTNHYLLTMTDAHKVVPALSATRPSLAQARARTQQLATAHATIVSSDWHQLPNAQSLVLPRGPPQP